MAASASSVKCVRINEEKNVIHEIESREKLKKSNKKRRFYTFSVLCRDLRKRCRSLTSCTRGPTNNNIPDVPHAKRSCLVIPHRQTVPLEEEDLLENNIIFIDRTNTN